MSHRPFTLPLPWVAASGLAIVLVGCSTKDSVTKKSEEVPSTPVKLVVLAQTEFQRTTLQPASVHAYYRTEVQANTSGFVKELKVDIGDPVEAGSILAQIDVPEMQMQREVMLANIRRLEAEEQRAQAEINLNGARVRSAQAKLAEAKSLMGGAEASLAASEAEFERTQDMVQRGSLQNRILDEVRKKRDTDLSSKDAFASSIDSAEAEVAVADAQKESAEADLASASAQTDVTRRQLDELDVLIDYATVKAPFAGIVTERKVEPGDLVHGTNGSNAGVPMFVVSQVDKVRVRIPVPESDATSVNQGDEVTLTFPSFADAEPIIAKVTRTSGSLDPSTRTMIVEVDLPNADGKLIPGMFGQASIKLSTKVDANMLPARSVRFDEGGKAYVYVVGKDETVSITNITTGLDDGNAIEVLSGVEPGQRVIDSHLKRFADGQRVAVLAN